MKLQELLHYRVNTENPTHQQKLVRLLLAFLGVMLVLTLISRAADSLTVAQVTVESPKSGAIEHTVTKEGILEANREVAVMAYANAVVENVEVYEGAQVKAGDLLFTLALGDLQKQLRQLQLDRQDYQLQLQEHALRQENTQQQGEKAKSRADEDYGYTVQEAQDQVDRAKKALKDARRALIEFQHDFDDWEEWDDDEEVSVGASGGGTDPITKAQAREQERTLERAVDNAQRDVETAELAREKALLDADRKIEDAEAGQDAPDLTPQRTALSIQKLDIKIAELQEVIASEGKVLSPVDGIITALQVSTGSLAASGASAIIAESSQGCRLRVPLDSEQAKVAERGGKAEVKLSGKQRGVQTAIESVAPSKDVPGGVDVLVLLEEGEIGQAATLEISKRSESYPQCVPLEAVRGASGDQYVLVLDEQDTVLGRQKVARKVPVTVADSNETRAAISGGALQGSDKVIIQSSKNIFAGDRVRLQEQ